MPRRAGGGERLAASGDYQRQAIVLGLATRGRTAAQLAEARTLGEGEVRVA